MNEANSRGVLGNAETAGNNVRTESSHDLNRKLGIVRRVNQLSQTRIGRVDLIDRIVAHRRKGSISRIVRTGTTGVGMIVVEMDARAATRIFEETHVETNEANRVRIHVQMRVVVKAEGNRVPKPAGNFVRSRARMCALIHAPSMTIMLRKMSRVRCGARMIIYHRRARSTLPNCRRCRWWT